MRRTVSAGRRISAKGENDMQKWILLRLVSVLLLGLIILAPAFAQEESNMMETPYTPWNDAFYNPIRVDDYLGDPWIVWHDGSYYYTHSTGNRVDITASKTISGLMAARGATKTIYMGLENNQTELWAPELHFYQGRWYCFYAADYDRDNKQHRMYVLRSLTEDALGSWEYAGKLNLPDDQWAIDGTFFDNGNGRIFLIWSGWKNEAQGSSLWKQYLYITELSPEDPSKVIGPERVMISKPEYYWEMSVLPQNEGPAMLQSPAGTFYCMYAANFSKSDDYAIGAIRLTGDDPMDASAWEKLPEPILASDPEHEVFAPGHASFTKSPDGTEDWTVYHVAKASGSGWDRCAHAQKVDWVDDTPYIGKPVPTDDPVPIPSGEQVDRILIQAEDGVLSPGAQTVEGPRDSLAVHFSDSGESCRITVSVKKAGTYALYVRHANPYQLGCAFWVSINEAFRQTVTAARSGAPGQFTMACITLPMVQGLNTVTLSAGPDVDIDLVILDRTPLDRD